MKLPDEPVIQELIEEFVDSCLVDINDFSKLVEEENEDDLYRMGHTIKGSCFQFGLDEIAQLGVELMGNCEDKNFEEIAKSENKIRSKFIEVKEFIISQK